MPAPLARPVTGILLVVIVYAAFVSLGLPDAVTGVAWPSIQESLDVPPHYLGGILAGLSVGYFTSGVLAGRLMLRLGIGGLLSGSCFLVALAMFANSLTPIWWMMVFNAAIWGLGSGAIDAGLNAYAANHFAAKHMNWMHACYSIGAAVGPIAMTLAVVYARSWRAGYLIVGAAMMAMMITFMLTRRQWEDDQVRRVAYQSQQAPASPASPLSATAALRRPLVWFHIVLFFFYTGFEALIGQWGFTWLTQARGIDVREAGFWVSAYFFAIGVGRVMTGVFVGRFGLDRMIRCSMLTAIAGTALMVFGTSPFVNCMSLVVIGFGLAAIFPCLMSRTPHRLGHDVSVHAVGFQIAAATVGVAAIPGLAGFLVQPFGADSIAKLALVIGTLLLTVHEWMLMQDA
jgi:fucose permease